MYVYDLIPGTKARLKALQREEFLKKIRKVTPIQPATPEELPSVYENDSAEIDFPKITSDGTIRTCMKGHRYPTRFYTPHEDVNVIASFKKLFSLLLQWGVPGIIALIIFKEVWKKWLTRLFELYPILFKEEHWSTPVKEIRRILKGRIDDVFLDAVSAVFEFDMAYRYRMQDVLSQLDKVNLQHNPIKELSRLLDIMITREKDRNVKVWKMVKKCLWMLHFWGLKEIKEVLMIMQVGEIEFTMEDKYWIAIVPNYDYEGLTLEERLAQRDYL